MYPHLKPWSRRRAFFLEEWFGQAEPERDDSHLQVVCDCLQTEPPPYVAVRVIEPWDPRVLLLVLACLHLHMTGVPRPVSILLLILTVVVGALARIQWPTIAACIAAALAALARPGHDSRHLVPTHLQTVVDQLRQQQG